MRSRTYLRGAKTNAALLAVDGLTPALRAVGRHHHALEALAFAMGLFCTLLSADYYRPKLSHSILTDAPLLMSALVWAVAAVIVVMAYANESLKGCALPTLLFESLAVMVVGRLVIYRVLRRQTRHGKWRGLRVLVVGDGDAAQRLVKRIRARKNNGYTLLGYVADDARAEPDMLTMRVGSGQDLPQIAGALNIDVVVFATCDMPEAAIAHAVRHTLNPGTLSFFLPSGYSLRQPRSHASDHLCGISVTPLTPRPRGRLARTLKRTIDVCAALVALVVLLPVLILVAMAVRIELGPGVIFRQVRVGQDEKTFTMYKFRSMTMSPGTNSDTTWGVSSTTHIGRVGTFIRSTSLDELPQLFNILKGDMSFVGPRPERPFFVDLYSSMYPDYRDRHRAPAGLTGYSAVYGMRGDSDIAERSFLDNLYIDNWSPWRDAVIIFRTVASVLGRHGS